MRPASPAIRAHPGSSLVRLEPRRSFGPLRRRSSDRWCSRHAAVDHTTRGDAGRMARRHPGGARPLPVSSSGPTVVAAVRSARVGPAAGSQPFAWQGQGVPVVTCRTLVVAARALPAADRSTATRHYRTRWAIVASFGADPADPGADSGLPDVASAGDLSVRLALHRVEAAGEVRSGARSRQAGHSSRHVSAGSAIGPYQPAGCDHPEALALANAPPFERWATDLNSRISAVSLRPCEMGRAHV